MASDSSSSPLPPPDQKGLIDDALRQVAASDPARSRQRQHRDRRPGGLPGYRILGQVHRGGQGVVYRAVQEATGRIVAVKMMIGGRFAGPFERARFEREVRILAQLRHPNIVTVHDSGVADDAAFYVMDYVGGQHLDDYVARQRPPLPERLRLFAKVCAAVNAAHLRGIIHRDLKPSNIHVDDSGEPYVLDFGLAKHSLWTTPGSSAGVTETGQFVGSMPWASPEQTRGRADEIDLRTDVYSLGVMLYQLLTDRFPYEVSPSIAETAQHILSTVPRNPRSINPRVDEDLATVVLKALRKDRESRYQTAGALGGDIERYLAGQPIEARGDSLRYVLGKQLARHKLAVGFAALVAVLIVASAVVSFTFWRQAERARDAEVRQKRTAQRQETRAREQAGLAAAEAAKANATSKFLIDMLASADPRSGSRADLQVRDAISGAVARLDAGALAAQGSLEAQVRTVIGRAYNALGLYDQSVEQFEKAVHGYRARGESESAEALQCAQHLGHGYRRSGRPLAANAVLRDTLRDARRCLGPEHAVVADCLFSLAAGLRDRGLLHEAEMLLRESLAIVRRAESPDEQKIAAMLNDLALSLKAQAKWSEAAPLWIEALEILRRFHGPRHPDVAVALRNLADLFRATGQHDKAEAMHLEALSILRGAFTEPHPDLANALSAMGLFYAGRRDYAQARPLLAEALEMTQAVHGEWHPATLRALNNYALALYGLGETTAAAEYLRQALEVFERTHDPGDPAKASLLMNLAAMVRVNGDLDEAVELVRQGLSIQQRQLGVDHPENAEVLNNLAILLQDGGRLEEAAGTLDEALRIQQAYYPAEDHPEVATTLLNLSSVLRSLDRLDAAEPLGRHALRMRQDLYGAGTLQTAEALHNLATILLDRRRYAEAECLAAEAVALRERHGVAADDWYTAVYRKDLGWILLEAGKLRQAEAELLRAYANASSTRGPDHESSQELALMLAETYKRLDQPADEKTWRERASKKKR